ncbi:MAG TPA: hypothetical protein VGX23_21700 [Actinocrinis sp.]|nr:hypothetical protein [Actinocrinis sp.]
MIAKYEEHGGAAGAGTGAGADRILQDPDVLECGLGELAGSVESYADADVEADTDVEAQTSGKDGSGDAERGTAVTDGEQQSGSGLHPVPASIAGLLSSTCAEIERDLLGEAGTKSGREEWAGPPAPAVPSFSDVAAGSSVPGVRRAYGVETVVESERGRWAVDVLVIFPDGVIRHRIDSFHTKSRAEVSARLIKRAAERELRGRFDV